MIRNTADGSLATGSFWSITDNFAQQALSFVIFVVLARFLAPDAFGLLTVAHLFILFARTVVFDAIAMPIVRSAKPDDRLYSWVFAMCTIAAAILCALMFFSAALVSILFRAPELKAVLQGMSISVLFFGLVRAYEARLVRCMMFRQLAVRSIISVVIGGVVGIALASRGAGAESLVAQQVTASGLALLLVVLQSRWRPCIKVDWSLSRRYWEDIRQVGASGILGYINANGDSFLVSIFLGPYATGLYNLAKRLTSAVYLVITSSMLKVALPIFSNAGKDQSQLAQGYLKIVGITLFFITPLLCFQAVLAKPLIALVFGAKWLPAAPTVAALALLYIVSSVTQLNDYIFFAVGKNRIPVVLGVAQLTIATAMVAAFYKFGLIGMSLSFCGAYLLVFPISQWLLDLSIGLRAGAVLIALAPPLAGGVALLLSLLGFLLMMPQHDANLILVGGGALLACLLYPLAVAVTGWSIRAADSSWHNLLLSATRLVFVRWAEGWRR